MNSPREERSEGIQGDCSESFIQQELSVDSLTSGAPDAFGGRAAAYREIILTVLRQHPCSQDDSPSGMRLTDILNATNRTVPTTSLSRELKRLVEENTVVVERDPLRSNSALYSLNDQVKGRITDEDASTRSLRSAQVSKKSSIPESTSGVPDKRAEIPHAISSQTTPDHSEPQSGSERLRAVTKKQLLILAILSEPAAFGLPAKGSIRQVTVRRLFPDCFSQSMISDVINSWAHHGYVEIGNSRDICLTPKGIELATTYSEQIAEVIKEALASGRKAEVFERRSAGRSPESILAKLRMSPFRLAVLCTAIDAADRDIDGKARVNPVELELKKQGFAIYIDGQTVTTESFRELVTSSKIHRCFEALHEAGLLSATFAPTELGRAVKVLQDAATPEDMRNRPQTGENSLISFLKTIISEPSTTTGQYPVESTEPEDEDQLTESFAPAAYPLSNEDAPQLATVVTASPDALDPVSETIVSKVEHLAQRFDQIAEVWTSAGLRSRDKEALQRLPSERIVQLLPAARLCSAIENTLAQQPGSASTTIEVTDSSLVVHLSRSDQRITEFLRYVHSSAGNLTHSLNVTAQGASPLEVELYEKTSAVITALHRGGSNLCVQYTGLAQSLANLSHRIEQVECDPLLTESSRKNGVSEALSNFQTHVFSEFTKGDSRGLPSSRERGSDTLKSSLLELRSTLNASDPTVILIALKSLELSNKLSEQLRFARALVSCQEALKLVGIRFSKVECWGSTRRAIRSKLFIESRESTAPREFEFRSLDVTNTGLVVQYEPDLSTFRVKGLTISQDTELTDVIAVLLAFETASREYVLNKVSPDEEYKTEVHLGVSDLRSRIQPPLTPYGRILVSDGNYSRIDLIRDSSFILDVRLVLGGQLLKPGAAACAMNGQRALKTSIEELFAYNIHLLQGLMTGHRGFSIPLQNIEKQDTLDIADEPGPTHFTARAEWLKLLVREVGERRLKAAYLGALSKAAGVPGRERLLQGAEALSSLERNMSTLSVDYGLHLFSVQSSADRLSLHFEGLSQARLKEVEALIEIPAETIDESGSNLGTREFREDMLSEAYTVAMLCARNSTWMNASRDSSRLLGALESAYQTGLIDGSQFERSKSDVIRKAAGSAQGHNTWISSSCLLSSRELRFAALAPFIFRKGFDRTSLSTLLSCADLLSRFGYGDVRIRPFENIPPAARVDPSGTFALNLDDYHGGPTFGFTQGSLFIAHSVDQVALTRTLHDVHKEIHELWSARPPHLGRILLERNKPFRFYSPRWHFSSDFIDKAELRRPVLVSDGKLRSSWNRGRIELELRFADYSVLVSPIPESDMVSIEQVYISQDTLDDSGRLARAKEKVEEFVIRALRNNHQVASSILETYEGADD